MAYNKFVVNNLTLLDLTSDTISADKLLNGYTAHDKSGNEIVGTLTLATVYTGSGEPDASLGSDGDIYLDMGDE